MKKLEELEEIGGEALREGVVTYANSTSCADNISAVICGVKHGIRDPRFLSALEGMTGSDAKIFGNRLSSFAKAALHVLGIREYTGDDDLALTLIETGFDVV